MLEQLSEDMLRWSKLYIVEIMYYTLACMMMLEDFPESRGRPIFLFFFFLFFYQAQLISSLLTIGRTLKQVPLI